LLITAFSQAGGDSGSWVIENTHGGVVGVVIARDDTQNVTYISPMELIFEDIKETLGARDVGLPTPVMTAFLELTARTTTGMGGLQSSIQSYRSYRSYSI